MVEYFLRLVFVSATGLNDKVFVNLYGPSNSGKTQLVEFIAKVLGSYAHSIPDESLCMGYPSQLHDVAEYIGKRFVFGGEVRGLRWNVSKINKLTGGNELTGCHKYERAFTFKPTHTLWIDSEKPPKADSDEGGLWNRVSALKLDRPLPEDRQRPEWSDYALREYGAGFLNVVIEAGKRYLAEERNLAQPQKSKDDKKQLRIDSDPFESFFAGLVPTPGAKLLKTKCYEAYEEDTGKSALIPRHFNKRMRAKEIQEGHIKAGDVWLGLALSEIA